ncbi:hypothetical protein CspHIS471_0108010 [Cutaneotrichosporon sp. HIS471]|nr:hypothetical protein CspHIS471_0108010 [Cutaneotrichosporon sp. HIS471]
MSSEAASLGSDGSDFRPPSDDGGDSDDYMDDNVMQVDEPPSDDGSYDDEDDFKPASRRGRGRGRGRGARTPRGRGTGTRVARKNGGVAFTTGTPKRAPSEAFGPSTIAAVAESDLMGMPPAYREYLLSSSVVVVKGPDWKKEYYPNTGGTRVPIFPLGPVTPFTTHLKIPPNLPRLEGRLTEIEVTPDEERGPSRTEARRLASRNKAKRFGLLEPWQVWEGEGWWPEMARSGDGPMEGWNWRSDVRLGLENVGRGWSQNAIPSLQGEAFIGKRKEVTLNLGRHDALKRVVLTTFMSAPIDNASEASMGFVFNAGAPVWGLDWCPYPERLTAERGWTLHLAVSTLPGDTPIGGRCAPDTPGAIQIWSVPSAGDATPRCEIVLCIEGGPASDLKWMPMGGWDELDVSSPKLGIVAAVQLDGSVSFYSVPEPQALRTEVRADGQVYIRAAPLLKISIPDASVTCIDWLGGTRLVTGLSNGAIAVWEVDVTNPEPPLPSSLTTIGLGPVRSVAAGRVPPTTADGQYDYTGDSVYVVSATWEGTISLTDLRDPAGTMEINRSRLPVMAVAWTSQGVTPLYADVDYMITASQLRNDGPSTHLLAPHRGPVWSIATSDYHTMIASAASDGALIISTFSLGFYRRKLAGLLYYRLYELDYDEVSGEYRMVDDFKPETSGIEEAIKHAGKKKSSAKDAQMWAPEKGDVQTIKTAAWSRNVSLHRTVWHTGGGLGSAGWLASGGYSGIVRVETMTARLLK